MVLPLTPIRFKRQAERIFGRKIGVVCGKLRFSYYEFNQRCDRLSDALLRMGVSPGERVAYLSFNCHRLLEAYYGVPQIGAILLPLNIRLTSEELAYILNDSTPAILFFDPEFTSLVERLRRGASSVRHYIALERHAAGVLPEWAHDFSYDDLLNRAEPLAIDYRNIDENSIAELFYTSGTTAYPKGVMLTHRNLYLHALYTAIALGCSDAEVSLYTVPLFHVNSWGTPHIATLVGGRQVMIKRFDPLGVLELAERERVTRLQMVPTMMIALLNHPDFDNFDLSSVKHVMIGGAPANTALIQQVEQEIPGCVAAGGYGLTETSPVLTIAAIKAHLACESEASKLRRKATAGYAVPGCEIRVVDPAGHDIQTGGEQMGEVVVRGDVLMAGYWRQPDATAEAIQGDWLHTGDIATIDEEGYILIVDRAKDMVLSGGENIATAEVERVLYQHPAVLECAVIAVPDDTWGEVPKAIITLRDTQSATEEEILEHCRDHLASFKMPQSVEFVGSFPKGGTGKILKRVLREKYWAGRDRRVH
jgi:fatty-acyl-CoA synthase